MMTFESKAHKVFELVCQLIEDVSASATEEVRVDIVERTIFRSLLKIGYEVLNFFFEEAGDGDVGERWSRDGKVLKRQEEAVARIYRTIFGVHRVTRKVYAVRAKQKTYAPLDKQLGFPEGEHSFFLQDILQRSCVKDSFDESVGALEEMFGQHVGKLTVEAHNQSFGTFIDNDRDASLLQEDWEEEEAEILVATADGKGVPMRELLEQTRNMPETPMQKFHRKIREKKAIARSKRRLPPGHAKVRKQMAWVGAVYTTDAAPRTANDLLDELDDDKQVPRPNPVNKRLWAKMSDYLDGEFVNGQDQIFERLAAQVQLRDPDAKKTLICLMDGQRSLWDRQAKYLPRAIEILDIYHVTEKLWDAAYCFHRQGSIESDVFVEHYVELLLEGKVSTIMRSLRAKLATLNPSKRKTVKTIIGYFENNQSRMKYDEYLAAGYPIASGVIEGGCRHLINDRMEKTGMRWKIDGAKAMLNTRSARINREWDQLFEKYVQSEQDRLYGVAA